MKTRAPNLIVRTATPSDAGALVEAIDKVAREGRFFLRSQFRQDPAIEAAFIDLVLKHGGTILVAEANQGLVGWLTLQRDKRPLRRHVCLLGMGVLKPFRGQGIGRKLVREALRFAHTTTGIERVELYVRATNIAAVSLYQSIGFAYEGRRLRSVRDQHGHYDDEILMAHLLDS